MARKRIKIIIWIAVIAAAYALIKKFPDQMILIGGIAIIIIFGSWMMDADKLDN